MALLPDYGDTNDPNVRAKYGKLEAKVGLVGNTLVFVGKLLLAIMVASVAILGDSLNHLMDIVVSGVILYSFIVAAKPADVHHPYGHGRAESILAIIVSFLVIAMGVLVIHEALSSLDSPSISADLSTVLLMLVFTAVKIFLALFAFSVARKIDSTAIRADAWNHLSDSMISIAVAVGVAITVLFPAYKILDPVLAIGIGLFVIVVGIKLVYDSAYSLMGNAPDKATLEAVEKCARQVPGVINVHGIEIHEYGAFKAINMHVRVAETMGAKDAHEIAENVEKAIRETFKTRPLVHIDPVKRHCDQCELDMIEGIAKTFSGVISVHKAMLQHTGDGSIVDMHVLIDGKTSVEKGHKLVHDIMTKVNETFPDHRIDIHLEPCTGNCPACAEECERKGSA
ncbi:MAG: cation-efflux pump [Candidatus Thermoplasmatota archaeon]|nr:cation-efflux pump [Candidatus Thermoplasmatota archaeon]MBU4071456.1 cation-efflux pump [Candidatus Thermoplasmatota archaeon]MBU4144440.1 cation-efflux pump [Candidatus Thermoplasmatota archaeon]MBU4592328.1 cation-efflux pump [Candidatus Thermoplasmatota archaeon]